MIILCPVGLVGAGKTTVVKPLAKKLGLEIISTDDIRKALKERGEGYEKVYEIAQNAADKYLKEGKGLAIDADCVGETATKLLKEVEVKYHPTIVWIHINPPEEFIIHKLTNFKHTWLFRDAAQALENYRSRKPLHAHLDLPFVYTFDTSKENLSEQIDEAAKIIEQL